VARGEIVAEVEQMDHDETAVFDMFTDLMTRAQQERIDEGRTASRISFPTPRLCHLRTGMAGESLVSGEGYAYVSDI